ncbi:MAG: nitrophenyl compound nitroreductase subunit ArsF family protein [Alphaproteobacteria bacterium]|nr:nitrophenyl compound nitroreductase subunit ArsF family protein [Alphaproteobacteria bacterium]
MTAKKITAILLLLFVTASIGTIVAKETGLNHMLATGERGSGQSEPPLQAAKAPMQPKAAISAKVVAYYFHGNYRCPTCRTIEAYTAEAINNGFDEDLKSGRVELKVVNIEEPGNEHFVQDYQLANRSVVVASYEGDNQRDWKRLDEVWQLVGNKDAFIRFVQNETAVFLKKSR